MRSRGFSARSSQINNVGSIDQALMQSMDLIVFRFVNTYGVLLLLLMTMLV
ncbi:hypothetical protein HID58_087571, partial [Brassica napus]